jgi:hypothetical protein
MINLSGFRRQIIAYLIPTPWDRPPHESMAGGLLAPARKANCPIPNTPEGDCCGKHAPVTNAFAVRAIRTSAVASAAFGCGAFCGATLSI